MSVPDVWWSGLDPDRKASIHRWLTGGDVPMPVPVNPEQVVIDDAIEEVPQP